MILLFMLLVYSNTDLDQKHYTCKSKITAAFI